MLVGVGCWLLVSIQGSYAEYVKDLKSEEKQGIWNLQIQILSVFGALICLGLVFVNFWLGIGLATVVSLFFLAQEFMPEDIKKENPNVNASKVGEIFLAIPICFLCIYGLSAFQGNFSCNRTTANAAAGLINKTPFLRQFMSRDIKLSNPRQVAEYENMLVCEADTNIGNTIRYQVLKQEDGVQVKLDF